MHCNKFINAIIIIILNCLESFIFAYTCCFESLQHRNLVHSRGLHQKNLYPQRSDLLHCVWQGSHCLFRLCFNYRVNSRRQCAGKWSGWGGVSHSTVFVRAMMLHTQLIWLTEEQTILNTLQLCFTLKCPIEALKLFWNIYLNTLLMWNTNSLFRNCNTTKSQSI